MVWSLILGHRQMDGLACSPCKALLFYFVKKRPITLKIARILKFTAQIHVMPTLSTSAVLRPLFPCSVLTSLLKPQEMLG
jgi:hypothetical protein